MPKVPKEYWWALVAVILIAVGAMVAIITIRKDLSIGEVGVIVTAICGIVGAAVKGGWSLLQKMSKFEEGKPPEDKE